MDKINLTLGRALLSAIFLISGVGKLAHWSATADAMAKAGLPAANLLLALSIAVEVGGGLLLLLGIKVRYVALVIAAWLVPVTLVFHNFWAYHGPEQQGQVVNFLKNLAIIGGLLLAAGQAAVAKHVAAAGGSART